MLIFFGHRATKIAEEQIKVNDQGKIRNAIAQVYQRYAHVFWIPMFPLYRNYIVYFQDTGETFTKTLFRKMPEEYLHAAKQVPARTPWWTFIEILTFGLLIFWLESSGN